MSDSAVTTALQSVGTYAKDGTHPDPQVFTAAIAAYHDAFGALTLGMAAISLLVSIVGWMLITRANRAAAASGLTSKVVVES